MACSGADHLSGGGNGVTLLAESSLDGARLGFPTCATQRACCCPVSLPAYVVKPGAGVVLVRDHSDPGLSAVAAWLDTALHQDLAARIEGVAAGFGRVPVEHTHCERPDAESTS